jgi:hypothetical protein
LAGFTILIVFATLFGTCTWNEVPTCRATLTGLRAGTLWTSATWTNGASWTGSTLGTKFIGAAMLPWGTRTRTRSTRRFASATAPCSLSLATLGMTVGITTSDRQDSSSVFRWMNKRPWLTRTTTLHFSTTTHFGAVCTVALKRTKPWG